MKLKFVMRDREYMSVLASVIVGRYEDIYIDAGNDGERAGRTMIVTDAEPESVDRDVIEQLGRGIVFLTEDMTAEARGEDADESGPYVIFKYLPVREIVSKLRLFYFLWSGEETKDFGFVTSVSVLSAGCAENAAAFGDSLASQLAYLSEGNVLLFPLMFFDRTNICEEGTGNFRMLMYYIKVGRKFPREAFFEKDAYGVYRFKIEDAINPLCRLIGDELLRVSEYLCRNCFDTVVFVVGEAYTEAAMEITGRCRNAVFIDAVRDRASRALFTAVKDAAERQGDGESGKDVIFIGAEPYDEKLDIKAEDLAAKMLGYERKSETYAGKEEAEQKQGSL